jgi:hypothetical protein
MTDAVDAPAPMGCFVVIDDVFWWIGLIEPTESQNEPAPAIVKPPGPFC